MIYLEVVLLGEVVEHKGSEQVYEQYTISRAFVGAQVTFLVLNCIAQVTR